MADDKQPAVDPGASEGATKAVTIAEPESTSITPDPEPEHPNTSVQNPKQYRATSLRRLIGRPPISPTTSMSMAQKNSPRTEGDELGHKDKDRPSSSRRQSLNFTHDLHHQLLSQVRNWLEQEKLKQPPHAHHSNESDAGSTSEQHASQLSGSDTLTSLQKLEQILEEHNWLIQAARNIVNKDSSAKRKLSMLGLKRGSSYPASSDTEYQDLDVKVPSVEAVLDNSKTLSYTGGAIDAQDEDVKEDIKGAKEQEGWLKFKNEIVRLAHTLRLKGWRQVPLDQGGDIEVQRLSGALTNAVYVVSPPRNLPQPTKNGSSTSLTIKKPKKLLLRIYGPQVEHLIDRESELQILKRLARKRIGPRLLGTFENGRFEEFFHAKTLTAEDLRVPDISIQIAKRMRELHDGIELLHDERKAGPFVWQNWNKWVARCEEVITWLDEQVMAHTGPITSQSEAWKSRGLICGVEWSLFRGAVDKYREWLTNLRGLSDIKQQLVFAHNDTQYGNLLRLEPSGESPLLLPANEHKRLVVIDFEYANANTRGLEFANHFSEWCYNYHSSTAAHACNTSRYPTPEEQRRFLRAYVRHRPSVNVHGSTPSGVATPATETTPGPSSSVTSFALDSRAPPSAPASKEKDDEEERQREAKEEKEIEDLIHQTRIWRVSNSAQWVAWGIVQAKVPGMDEALDKKRVEIQAKQRSMSRRVWEKLSGKSGTAKKAGAEDEEGSMEDMEGLEPTKGGEDKPNIPHEHETDDDAEFDYLAYAQERALFFWGDILELGIVQESDLPAELVKAAKRVPY